MADEPVDSVSRGWLGGLSRWLKRPSDRGSARRSVEDESRSGAPSRIGHYAIGRRLGAGGMGVVYEAYDERLQRRVALKMLLSLEHDDTARKRFWREARAAASVNHPNVCQIYEVGEADGNLFITMELLEGEPLTAILARGPLSVDEVVPIAMDILAALGAIHARGIVHRDLKPSNVFVTHHGVKLLDFGLARPEVYHTQELATALTRTGMVMGTPRYMAPEQATGDPVDARTDLFAVGAIMFEMLAGRPAFNGRTIAEVLSATLTEQPPALTGSLAVAAVDRIIRRALAKHPTARPISAEAMADQLNEVRGVRGHDTRANAESRPLRVRQTVRYVNASDGVRLAWAESGSGMPLVKAATWLTHLEHDLDSPVWRHWIGFLSDQFRFVRYDERGCGMSDWSVDDLSLERRVADLETVVDAAQLTEPFVLLGISQGAAVSITYAVKHPDRVSRMILFGGFARGALRRGEQESARIYRAILDLTTLWGSDNSAFREVFTSRFIPEGTDEQLRWFSDLCRKTTAPELAGTLLRARADVDVSSQLPHVRTPTLVIHARGDQIAPVSEGRLLASEIADAQFVELESSNHILLERESAWPRFRDAVLDFTGASDRGSAA